MNQFKSRSQAGQDIFVHRLIPGTGTFLDIGCGDDQWSNTLALQELGWTGLLVEVAPNDQTRARVKNGVALVSDDATKMDWSKYRSLLPSNIEYLSLDVDHAGLDALKNLPLDKMQFKVITIEHDFYRFGDELRTPMREILQCAGYTIVHFDVCGSKGMSFEEWALAPELALKYLHRPTHGMYWEDILAL